MGNDDFECLRVIGNGSYGEVWLAKHKRDKKQYVLKKMNLGKASKRERKSAEQEAKLLSNLKHPNIVSYKDSFETGGFLYIAMQYCEGGDLYARLKEQKGCPLEERQVVEWFVQIAMALQYMHERNILHRDLKTQNIFLTKSKIIKVGDLGIARILESSSAMATTLIGTPYYMSPELFSNKPYNYKSDVWALGCCVYEMTTLKHAFNARDMNSLVYKILKGKMPPMPSQYSSELLVLMRSMLLQDPEKRPSVNRILRDPYIKKNIAIFLEDTKRSCRQTSHPSSSQTAASVSKHSSAFSNHRDSASSLSDLSQASSILNSDPQRPKIQSPKKEGLPRKKNFLQNHVKSRNTEQNEIKRPFKERSDRDYIKPSLDQAKNNERVIPFLQNHNNSSKPEQSEMVLQAEQGNGEVLVTEKPVLKQDLDCNKMFPEHQSENKTRPLPVPRVKTSASPPQERQDRVISADFSTSLSVSSSTEDTETHRSLPNLSARQRRRQQMNDFAELKENPNSALIKLKRAPEKTESDKVMQTEKRVLQVEAMDPLRKPTRQPSINDSTSSSDEFLKVAEKEHTKEKEAKRENKEINNLICLLNTTLQMNNRAENSEEEEEEEERALKPVKKMSESSLPPPQSPQEPSKDNLIHKSVSMPSVETLTDTSRLMQRIRLLHADCIKGVGYQALKKAYEILNKIDEDEVEPQLVDLLGKKKFDEYAGKIWQLKFCEESLFISS
ncbi:hypothetical protein BsWGS_11721 [Bradybaena similaris]